MAIKTVFFDLDGTLLPMDQDEFVKAYFGNLAGKLSGHGYEPKELIGAIWSGTKAMVKNDGHCTNEEAFWEDFAAHYGQQVRKDEPLFEEFYKTDFQHVQKVCGFAPQAAQTVSWLKERGIRLVLATNPIFPAIATRSRIKWAGLTPEDFVYYTTYENAHYCKPDLRYYREICQKLELSPEECLMVGNDVGEDMVAKALGMQVFLLTDCLINRQQADISCYPNGDFDALAAYLKEIL